MHSINERTNIAVVFSLLFLVVIAVLSISKSLFAIPAIFLSALFLIIITFLNTEVAIIILIFSMLLSPEFAVGGTPNREVVLRADDLFLFVIFFSWLSRMAINKELGLLRSNPLNKPILIYIFIVIVATLLGVMQEDVKMKSGFFFILKYTEYFLLFFMVSNNLKDIRQIRTYVFLLLLTCLIVSSYAWYLKFAGFERVAAPFDVSIGGGESNTLAGYLLLMMAVAMGILVYSGSLRQRIFLTGFLGFIVPPFLFTLSRGAWLGFFPMFVTLILLSKRSKFILLSGLLILIALLPVVMPQSVADRMDETFSSGKKYTILGKDITIDESGSARLENWRQAIKRWSRRPVLGYGVTGAGFIDAQFPRVLGETGLIGFMAFLWLIAAIFIKGKQTFNRIEDDWAKGVTLGFLAGFVGLLVQSVSASTFIIVRIMEPFWFLTAIVIMLPEMNLSPEKHIEDVSWKSTRV